MDCLNETTEERTVFKPDPTDLAFYYNHSGDIRQTLFVELGQEMQEVRVTDHWPSSTKSVCLISPEWL